MAAKKRKSTTSTSKRTKKKPASKKQPQKSEGKSPLKEQAVKYFCTHEETSDIFCIECCIEKGPKESLIIIGSCPAKEPLGDVNNYKCTDENNQWVKENIDKLKPIPLEVFTRKDLQAALMRNRRPIVYSNTVPIPLRECDYDKPMKSPIYPFVPDSEVVELNLPLAANLCLKEPECRKFIGWPEQKIPPYVIEIMRRRLLGDGSSDESIKYLKIADVAELLKEERNIKIPDSTGSDEISYDEKPDTIVKNKPVSKIAGLILLKLKELPEHQAMDTPALLAWLSREHKKDIDDKSLRRHLDELKPYGLQNKPKIGYFIR